MATQPDMPHDAALPPDQVREDYNRTVREARGDYIQYRWLNSPTQRRHHAQTKASLEWATAQRAMGDLLEVGCGPAVWTPLFLETARTGTLVDISDEMLDGARRALEGRKGISFVRGDFAEVALTPGMFDTVVSIRAFEYMPNKEAILARFVSMLRPGGRLILVTKNAGWRDHRKLVASMAKKDAADIPSNVRLQADVIDWEALQEMARESGLRAASIHPVVLGSYLGLSRTFPALRMLDALHTMTYRAPMRAILSEWTESVMLIGTR